MTVDDYLAKLPADRRTAIAAVRDVINANLPEGYEEGILYGMPSWFVPRSRLAETYNGQPLFLAGVVSKQSYMSLHLMCVYGDPKLRAWFEGAFAARGKKLDMGKGCVRFKTLDAIPLDVIGELVAKIPVDKYVASYHASRAGRATATKKPAKKPAKKIAKKPAAKRR